MPIAQFLMNKTFKIYRYASTAIPNGAGEMPSPVTGNLEEQGETKGRVTPGDSLEPDVLGVMKDYRVDVSSMWIGFFNEPSECEIHSGDVVVDQADSTRQFQIQFIDRYPGGTESPHHYECRLITTEVWRNG